MRTKHTENETIRYQTNDILILGEFITRTTSYIRIRIVYPYVGWTAKTENSGDKNFLTQEGNKAAEKLLLSGYEKLSIIDKFIDNLAYFHDDLLEELSEIDKTPDCPEKDNLRQMLIMWFYEYFMFRPHLTGLRVKFDEVQYFEEILITYKSKGVKLYHGLYN